MTAPSLCTISGTLYLAATGQGGALVRWRVVSGEPPVSAGDGHASGDPTVTYTDSSGDWTISVPQGLWIWLEIPAIGLDHYLQVPAEATSTLDVLALYQRVY